MGAKVPDADTIEQVFHELRETAAALQYKWDADRAVTTAKGGGR